MPRSVSDPIAAFKKILEDSRAIVFLGGAGVSTESGIPDFRSTTGLYQRKYPYPAEVMLSRSFFDTKPEAFYDFYRGNMLCLDAAPNAAHFALSKLEAAGKLTAVITQNIDGLHQMAGAKNVLELHGSIHRNYCMRCHKFYPPEFIADNAPVPLCACGGIVKPDVVLYEEGLDSAVLEQAVSFLRRADTLIIGGTSLTVYPAAGLVNYFKGGNIVVINKDKTGLDDDADLVINAPIGEVLQSVIGL